jgi:hypothetical protein
VITAVSSSTPRVPASTSWIRPETRSPNQFIVKTTAITSTNVSTTVRRPPPVTSAT